MQGVHYPHHVIHGPFKGAICRILAGCERDPQLCKIKIASGPTLYYRLEWLESWGVMKKWQGQDTQFQNTQ